MEFVTHLPLGEEQREEGFSSLHLSSPQRGLSIPVVEGELWTARQRQMHSIHYTVSYRASFKPELPDYFMRRYLHKSNSLVLDPFGGRGTTTIQANLLGHRAVHNDLNPLSIFLSSSRQTLFPIEVLEERVHKLNLQRGIEPNEEEKRRLYPFFHPQTLRELLALRKELKQNGEKDAALKYIGVTALSRLHGHSEGFFSVYTFPQISILPEAQRRNNINRNQKPEYRSVADRIIKKMRKDLSEEIPEHFHRAAKQNRYLCGDAVKLKGVRANSIDLIVTSPPFLDKVNYVADNWMRSWFLDYEKNMEEITLTNVNDPNRWATFMSMVMNEMVRVLKKNSRAVIEVGEVTHGKKTVHLEKILMENLPIRTPYGSLVPEELYINRQTFTKLANCWSVTNNEKGTNTNRCLVLRKTE